MKASIPVDQDSEYNLWILLGQTRNAILKARRRELQRHNISSRHILVLFVVQGIEARGEKATPANLSRWLILKPHSVSELLKRMTNEGLVRKVKDLDRKNQVRVELTDKGREAYGKSTDRKSIHRIMSALSKEEQQQVWSSLKTLRDKALKEFGAEYEIPFPPSR